MPVRVALVDCEDAAKWENHMDVWSDALTDPAAAEEQRLEWVQRYRACIGELPTSKELDELDAIVIPGSHHSARDVE